MPYVKCSNIINYDGNYFIKKGCRVYRESYSIRDDVEVVSRKGGAMQLHNTWHGLYTPSEANLSASELNEYEPCIYNGKSNSMTSTPDTSIIRRGDSVEVEWRDSEDTGVRRFVAPVMFGKGIGYSVVVLAAILAAFIMVIAVTWNPFMALGALPAIPCLWTMKVSKSGDFKSVIIPNASGTLHRELERTKDYLEYDQTRAGAIRRYMDIETIMTSDAEDSVKRESVDKVLGSFSKIKPELDARKETGNDVARLIGDQYDDVELS